MTINDKLEKFLYSFLDKKPTSISDLNELPYDYTGGHLKTFLYSLNLYKFSDIAKNPNELSSDFKVSLPQHFITEYKKNYLILVDTQGYNWIRYGCIITNYPKNRGFKKVK